MRTNTKKAIQSLKNRMKQLQEQLEKVVESALKDDEDQLLSESTEVLARLNEVISTELYTRRACIEAEKELQAEEEKEGVWEKARRTKKLWSELEKQ